MVTAPCPCACPHPIQALIGCCSGQGGAAAAVNRRRALGSPRDRSAATKLARDGASGRRRPGCDAHRQPPERIADLRAAGGRVRAPAVAAAAALLPGAAFHLDSDPKCVSRNSGFETLTLPLTLT